MTRYAVVWHPRSENLGDDLQALSALRLTPDASCVLDGERLDAPIPGLAPEDRVVTLLSGQMLREPAHWPPEAHIAPVCVGMHFSGEDVWGMRLADMSGVGLRYLKACAPLGVRDDGTRALLSTLDIPCEVTACLTLTLTRPDVPAPEKPYVCCVDAPENVAAALRKVSPGPEVRVLTHQRQNDDEDFHSRMDAADALLRTYAAADFVVTRRLHCAMACLAVGTPVLLLYNSGYEDVSRFAPMDGMICTQAAEDFLGTLKRGVWPRTWHNPDISALWREKLINRVQEGLKDAETRPLPAISPEEAEAWRRACLERLADASARKIRRLEKEQYEALHEKFTLLLKEDSVKSALTNLLSEPEVLRALEKASRRRYLASLPWYRRAGALIRLRRQGTQGCGAEELQRVAEDQLLRLGWPEGTR